jgi:photosystem II stability/assembly factor-like uncharacterized protein
VVRSRLRYDEIRQINTTGEAMKTARRSSIVHRIRRLALSASISALLVSGAGISAAASGEGRAPTLTPQSSGTTNRLQAISPVSSEVVWASGVGGTFAVTTNGGRTWRAGVVPGAATLQFRDVQGVSDDVAYLLAAGTGTDSRIYRTTDGGMTWTLQFENQDPNGFYDCFAFWTPRRGLTMADGVNGRFPVVRTSDGTTWQDIGGNLPAAQPNEGAFAASGTCVATHGSKQAWIATTNARIMATTNGGSSWAAYATPIAGGTGTAGVFSVAFRDSRHGIIAGGDFASAAAVPNFARSTDGGKHWRLTTGAPIAGAVFGAAYAGDSRTVVATGPAGSTLTTDEGMTWSGLPALTGFWAVAFANEHVGWLVGTQGHIERITLGDGG